MKSDQAVEPERPAGNAPERIWILADDLKIPLPLVPLAHPLRSDAIEYARAQPSSIIWLDEANKVVGMFPDFAWPDRMSFSEAVAEQLIRMRRLPTPTAVEDAREAVNVTDMFTQIDRYSGLVAAAIAERRPCSESSHRESIRFLLTEVDAITALIIQRERADQESGK